MGDLNRNVQRDTWSLPGLQDTLSIPVSTHLLQVPASERPEESVADALRQPLEMPPLSDCLIEGDHLVIVADPAAAGCRLLLIAAWEHLGEQLQSLKVTVLLPPDPSGAAWKEFCEALPDCLRRGVRIRLHDRDLEDSHRYLAGSERGVRIYLAQELTEADFLLVIGEMRYDSQFGVKGVTECLYPSFGNREQQAAVERLPSAEQRREAADETAWLLGTQLYLQSIAASGGGLHAVLAGGIQAVRACGEDLLRSSWQCSERNFDLVIVTAAVQGPCSWDIWASALRVAAECVAPAGRIVMIVGQLSDPGPALSLLMAGASDDEVREAIREHRLEDAYIVEALQHAGQAATLTLMAASSAVEEWEQAGVTVIESIAELQRVIDNSSRCLILEDGYRVGTGISGVTESPV